MRDYFDVLGVSHAARASEIRWRHARRVCRLPPDFCSGTSARIDGACVAVPSVTGPRLDVAIDFVDIAAVLDRVQAAFFAGAS